MAHDVLISYSSRDKLQADAICNRLESRGIRCWIAPRDVGLGEYAERIVEAIEKAKIMLLVYSANADQSHQVRREVERAVSKGTTIVPVRIEDHEMSKAFELYVGSMHWLDAITPPLEQHIDRLADQLQALLASEDRAEAPAPAGDASQLPPLTDEPTEGTSASETPAEPEAPPAPAAPLPSQPAVGGRPATGVASTGRGKLGRGKLVGVGVAAVALVLLLFLIFGSGSEETPEAGDGEAAVGGEAATGAVAGEEAAAASSAAGTVEMTFENTTAVPVLVYAVDELGYEEVYQRLGPGRQWTAETSEGEVWVVRTEEGDGELEITECAAPASGGSCVIDLVTGHDVTRVAFESDQAAGAFAQTGPASWVEEGAEGEARFRLTETDRDDWSVYLHDASRGVDLQIDLWTDQVLYSDANTPDPWLLYRIVDAERD